RRTQMCTLFHYPTLFRSRSKPVSQSDYAELYRIVRELTQARNMPMPRIYVSEMLQPNAFATGRNPNHAAVSVTQGILQILDEREDRKSTRLNSSHLGIAY